MVRLFTVSHRCEIAFDTISLNNIGSNWDAVGISSNNRICEFLGDMILRQFWPYHNVMGLNFQWHMDERETQNTEGNLT